MALGAIPPQVVIIGNGVAGGNAALALKSRLPETEVTIISREPWLEYSACALPDYLAGYLTREEVMVKHKQHYQNAGINLLLGQSVTGIDVHRQKILLAQKQLNYDKLVIATGSRAILPGVPGARLPGNFTLKSLQDAEELMAYPARSAVVVGSGAIGIETAMALKEKGYEKVWIIEMMDQVLPRSLDREPARQVARMLENRGIQVLTGEGVEQVLGSDRVTGVKTGNRQIDCQLVLWAVGVRPNVELAKDAGLALGVTGGIKVDQYLKTSNESVYACGDCIETEDLFSRQKVLSLLWQPACQQGRTVGINLAGGQEEYEGSAGVLLIDLWGTKCLATGLTGKNAPKNSRTLESMGNNGYKRLIVHEDKLVGMQIIGGLQGTGPMLHLLKSGFSLRALKESWENPALASLVDKPMLLKPYLDLLLKAVDEQGKGGLECLNMKC